MKFREVVEVNRSPKIEGMLKLNDSHILIHTSDSVYDFDITNDTIQEVEFTKK